MVSRTYKTEIVKKPTTRRWCKSAGDQISLFNLDNISVQNNNSKKTETDKLETFRNGNIKERNPILTSFNNSDIENVPNSIELNSKSPNIKLNSVDIEFEKEKNIPEDGDIVNPFDDLSENNLDGLSNQEQEDLDDFNIGIQLEFFRTNIEQDFPRQDFAQFVDVEEF